MEDAMPKQADHEEWKTWAQVWVSRGEDSGVVAKRVGPLPLSKWPLKSL